MKKFFGLAVCFAVCLMTSSCGILGVGTKNGSASVSGQASGAALKSLYSQYQTDGQILVMQDALGLTVGHTPKFAFNFLKETGNVIDAVKLYISKVESGEYPTAEQSFA